MAMSGKLKLGILAFVLFDLLLAVTLVSLYQVRSERKSMAALQDLGFTQYPEARNLDAFALVDENGNTFTEANLAGSWNFLFFGFTSCPDICPLTMSELEQFYAGLSEDERSQARVIMVSVDPMRDDSAAMAGYVDAFHTDFVGLTGNINVIANLASQFFIAHSKPVMQSHNEQHVQPDSSDYLIEHSGHLAIVNPDGKFAAVLRPPIRDRDLTTVYQSLLDN